jgi:hypothetical protein
VNTRTIGIIAALAFVGTCASVGRRPHGATGAHDPVPGEHYGNVEPIDIAAALQAAGFSRFGVTYEIEPRGVSPTTHDAHWWAVL